MKFTSVFETFASQHGIDDISPDENGRVTLLFDGDIPITLEQDETNNVLLLHAPVFTADNPDMPVMDTMEVYRSILEFTLLGAKTNGHAVSLAPEENMLIVWKRFPLDSFTQAPQIETIFNDFLSVIPLFQDAVSNAQNPEAAPASASMSQNYEILKI